MNDFLIFLFSILLFGKILKAAEDGKAFLPGKAQRKWKEAQHLIFWFPTLSFMIQKRTNLSE